MTAVIFEKGDFMRKQLTVALGLAVLATPAFATKARLQALGEDTSGSFYVNDNRNIFLNPAQVNNHKDLVTFEWGSANGSTAATGNSDLTSSQRGEGGVFRQSGSLVYGLQFNHSVAESNAFRFAGGLSLADVQERNVLTAFVGGDAGVKWGAGLDYTGGGNDERKNAQQKVSQEAMRLRLGGIMGDLQAFANLNLINRAEDAAGASFEGKLGYRLGATYNLNGTTLFADWRSLSADADQSTAAGVHDEALNAERFELGAARVSRLNDRANLFTRVSFLHYNTQNNRADRYSSETAGVFTGTAAQCSFASAVASCVKYNTQRINAVVGLETEATSWLTLRGSVGQVIWGNEEDRRDERSVTASTAINAGASLKFGELTVDGVIGNNDGTTAAATTDTSAGAGSLRTDLLMTRVAMTYRF